MCSVSDRLYCRCIKFCDLADRDAKIRELSAKVDNLQDSLHEARHRAQLVEGDAEVQSRKIKDLEARITTAEQSKIELVCAAL